MASVVADAEQMVASASEEEINIIQIIVDDRDSKNTKNIVKTT